MPVSPPRRSDCSHTGVCRRAHRHPRLEESRAHPLEFRALPLCAHRERDGGDRRAGQESALLHPHTGASEKVRRDDPAGGRTEMKQLTAFVLAILLLLVSTGCGSSTESDMAAASTAEPKPNPEMSSDSSGKEAESASKAPTPVQFGLIAEQILSGADGDIHYSYYLPESYDGSREYPLMVVMPEYDMMWFGESSSGRNINWSGFTAWTKLDTERCGGVYLHGLGRRVLRQREGALRLRKPARSLRSCGLERCGHFDFLLPFDVPHGRYLREKAASSTPSHAARLSGVGSRSARS